MNNIKVNEFEKHIKDELTKSFWIDELQRKVMLNKKSMPEVVS